MSRRPNLQGSEAAPSACRRTIVVADRRGATAVDRLAETDELGDFVGRGGEPLAVAVTDRYTTGEEGRFDHARMTIQRSSTVGSMLGHSDASVRIVRSDA
jgi:hypothetical protein